MKDILNKKCIVCGEMFAKTARHSKTSWKAAKFCSKACWSVRGTNVTKQCKICNKEFTLPAHIMAIGSKREKQSCSRECRYLLTTGTRSYMWKGEEAKYNLRIRDAIANTVMYRKWRKDIKDRDKHICVNCNESKKNLHVHHIYPLAQIIKDENWNYDRWTDLFKTPKSRLWDTNNGVTVCSDCHNSLISYALQHKGFSPK